MEDNRNLLGLFGKDVLEKALKTLSAATDFSFSAIDYRGEPVTGVRSGNDDCRNGKCGRDACEECQLSAAFAAAKAAIKNCPYIFTCPKGLTNIAIPIIVNDQYIGAVIGGSVFCSDGEKVEKAGGEKSELFEGVPEFSYEKISSIADLAFLLLQKMGEKETCSLRIANLEHKEIHLADMRKRNQALRKSLKELDAENMKARLLPQFLLNMFVTASSFAILENAGRTEEVIRQLCSILRYYTDRSLDKISLGNEFAQIGQYLSMIKMQYEDRFDYRVQSQKAADVLSIPVLTIFPFVEYIVNLGILPGHYKGTLYMDAVCEGTFCQITIQLESSEFLLNRTKKSFDTEAVMDDIFMEEQMDNAKKRLGYEYGEDCDISVKANVALLKIPMNREEQAVVS